MPDTLISSSQALKILSWVTYSSLYSGSQGTRELTRFPAGRSTLYSKQECEILKAKTQNGTIGIKKAEAVAVDANTVPDSPKARRPKRQKRPPIIRQPLTELV